MDDDKKGIGPIPDGDWKIIPHKEKKLGPTVFKLEPYPDTDEYGRDGFRIHGKSYKHPDNSSTGCIVLDPGLRQIIQNRLDNGGGIIHVGPSLKGTELPE